MTWKLPILQLGAVLAALTLSAAAPEGDRAEPPVGADSNAPAPPRPSAARQTEQDLEVLPLPPEAAPSSPREFYNAGTQKLTAGKLKEAEAMLENAVSSQSDRVQPVALYNLGWARFRLGVEELKKGPKSGPATDQGRAADEAAEDAIRSATDALASNEVNKMVASYLQGRGARRELNAAIKVVKRALQVYGTALTKWQRAAGDFKSAAELNPADENARHNGEVMDRYIAKLIDSLRELEHMAANLGQQKQELGQKMKELRGRIPEPDMPPGAAGDDEEEEDKPNGPREGQEEGPTRDGDEQRMSISEEQAAQILEGFKLDEGRRLPMGQGETYEPRERNRPTW